MNTPLRVAILGSTGSIGKQALEVARAHPDAVEVVALAAHASADALLAQAREFRVQHLALADEQAARLANRSILPDDPFTAIEGGAPAVTALASLGGVDLVLNALVGSSGLRATITALTSGKILALANKESLVVGGDLVMGLVRPGKLLPVDSEHSAIFQCLIGENADEVARIWLTASGGPFRGRNRAQLQSVTAADALAHPTWTMGPKITIDSATLMNKGLEVIEAHHLFGLDYDHICVVVHPQSCVHSMVEYTDGSVKAHLGVTDMRIPIQYAMSYPWRWAAPAEPLDFTTLGTLEFGAPDLDTFGCLRLALEAGRQGGSAPTVLNAANEVAVAAFLGQRIGLLDIERTVQRTLERCDLVALESVEHVEELDWHARRIASEVMSQSAR